MSQPPTRHRVANWLDTTGRRFAGTRSAPVPCAPPLTQPESPFNSLATSALALSQIPGARQSPAKYPRVPHLALFAGAYGASAFVAQQGYTVDAAGAAAAWSALYLAVNGFTRSMRAVGPALLCAKVAFDGGVNAWYWGNTQRWAEE